MATTKQLITDFYKVAQERDFTRNHQFRVLSIDGGTGSGVKFSETDLVYIQSSTLPGKAVGSNTVAFMGLNFNIPGSVNYPNSGGWSVTFLSDQKNILRDKVLKWVNEVFNDATSTGNYLTPKSSSTIVLVLFDNKGEVIKKYKLVGCYPVSVGDMTFETTGNGNVVQLPVTLAYQYWEDIS